MVTLPSHAFDYDPKRDIMPLRYHVHRIILDVLALEDPRYARALQVWRRAVITCRGKFLQDWVQFHVGSILDAMEDAALTDERVADYEAAIRDGIEGPDRFWMEG